MHMIKVLRQNEMIPKVSRCFGSPMNKYGGLLGVVVSVAGFSIDSVDQERQSIYQSGEWGFPRLRGRAAIYMRAYCMRYIFGM